MDQMMTSKHNIFYRQNFHFSQLKYPLKLWLSIFFVVYSINKCKFFTHAKFSVFWGGFL